MSVHLPTAEMVELTKKTKIIDDLLGGTATMRKAAQTYLFQMEMEEPDSYRKRLERSTLYPALSETLSQMTGRVFFNPIDVADVTETVQALFDDVDLVGNNLDVFASRWFYSALAYGCSFVLIDFTRVEAVKSRAEEKALNARPYWVHIKPHQVLGIKTARVNGKQAITQFRYVVNEQVEDGEFGVKTVKHVYVYEIGKVRKFSEAEGEFRFESELQLTAQNRPLDFVPVVPFITKRNRSILQLVTKSWEELGVQGMQEMPTSTRASMDGPVDERVNYESWLNSKTAEEKEQILGKGKADLWQRGVITFSDMLDQSGRPMTLKELYSKPNLAQEYNPMDVIKKYQQAVEIEPKITKAVTTIIASVDGEVAGLEYRLKSMDSLKRKIETEMTAGISEQQAIDNIKDVIRYTAIFSPENFVTQYREMQSALEKQGYKTIIVKNTWRDGAVYKGINTFITTLVKKDNVIFEMQYHTSESFALKNGELHQLYERFRDPNTEQEEKEKLYIEMQKLSAKLVMPKDIQKIKGVK